MPNEVPTATRLLVDFAVPGVVGSRRYQTIAFVTPGPGTAV